MSIRPADRGVTIQNGIWIPTLKRFGALVKIRRKEMGASQQEIAQEIGVSYKTIMAVENNGTANVVLICLLCEKFGFDLRKVTENITLKNMREL